MCGDVYFVSFSLWQSEQQSLPLTETEAGNHPNQHSWVRQFVLLFFLKKNTSTQGTIFKRDSKTQKNKCIFATTDDITGLKPRGEPHTLEGGALVFFHLTVCQEDHVKVKVEKHKTVAFSIRARQSVTKRRLRWFTIVFCRQQLCSDKFPLLLWLTNFSNQRHSRINTQFTQSNFNLASWLATPSGKSCSSTRINFLHHLDYTLLQTYFILLNKSTGRPLSLGVGATFLILLKVLLFIVWIPFPSQACMACCITGL